ncbi:hypothetical protein ACO0QE_000436 [Hanseniaspora vineae]
MSNIIDTGNIIQDIVDKIDEFLVEELKEQEKAKSNGFLEVDVSALKGLLNTIKDELKPMQDMNSQEIKSLQEENRELRQRVVSLETMLTNYSQQHQTPFTTSVNSNGGNAPSNNNNAAVARAAAAAMAVSSLKSAARDDINDTNNSSNDNNNSNNHSENNHSRKNSNSSITGKKRSRKGKAIDEADSNGTATEDADGLSETLQAVSNSSSALPIIAAAAAQQHGTPDFHEGSSIKQDSFAPLTNHRPESLPKRRKKWAPENFGDIETFQLIITEAPESVAKLYDEFETSVKQQIHQFELKYGKGKLSKIPKIRTYQRRAALVREIQSYANVNRCSVDEAIQFFDKLVNDNKKSVAWLYNNLAKVLNDNMI